VTALPYTPTRLRLAKAIAAGEVEHYPFVSPWTWDQTTGRLVTANVRLLVDVGLAEIPAVDPAGPHNYSVVRLTPAGEQWLARGTKDDAEFEAWLAAAGKALNEALAKVIDTEASLARVKSRIEGPGPDSTSPEPGRCQTFNPAYRVARCGQQSAHGPHVMEHGPDVPRNCPGTGAGRTEGGT
jgi:hypothetical protein